MLPAFICDKIHWGMLQKKVFDHSLPGGPDVAGSSADWQSVLSSAQEHIDCIRKQLKQETEDRDRERLQLALDSCRGDFGRRKRTFKAALLKNPPQIPLWGAISSHPDSIAVDGWTCARLRDSLPLMMWDCIAIKPTATGCAATCSLHTDVAHLLHVIPEGHATILPAQPRLVADVDNKLTAIEFFFASNALGVLPRCAEHMSTPLRQVFCVSSIVNGQREIKRYCNECRSFCSVQSPCLTPAVKQLPLTVFSAFNQIPENYDTHL